MSGKLSRQGEEYVLVLAPEIVNRLGIGPDTPLDVSTQGDVLIVTPVRGEERQRKFREALEKGKQRYARMLKRLAE
jgi:antitoxin MazE